MIPIRPLMLWNNNRKMKKFLTPLIEEDIGRFDSGHVSNVKTINYLAVKAFRSELQQPSPASKAPRVDPKFLDMAISQLKIFIFAGHDTTASTVSFAYSRLYRHRDVLAKIRAEHDEVLGRETSQALARLTENPNLLNREQNKFFPHLQSPLDLRPKPLRPLPLEGGGVGGRRGQISQNTPSL
jgi:hypothetical protein